MSETININKEELKELIRESLSEVLSEYGFLNEMTLCRKDYKQKVYDLSEQVLQNWCLLRYTTIVGQTKYRTHWRGQLIGVLKSIAKFHLKKNDSVEAREKVISEVFI